MMTNKCRFVRRAILVASLALLAGPAPAQFPAISNLADLVTMVDGSITGGVSRMIPPGQNFIGYDFGVVLYGSGVDTNFLNALTPSAGPGNVQLRPLEVVEQTDSSRARVYFNAGGTPAYTSAPPSGYDWMTTARDTYGNPPAWLAGEEWTNWYADRDPARLRPRFTLMSETGLAAYAAALDAMVPPPGTNSLPLWMIDSNNISFVRITQAQSLADMLVYAPSGVSKLVILKSQDMMNPTGWTFSATLNCASNFVQWRTPSTLETAFYAAGLTNSLDGSSIPAIVKQFVYGLNPAETDTDCDNVLDYLEIAVYGTDPQSADTDRDGVPDGPEIAAGCTSPKHADTFTKFQLARILGLPPITVSVTSDFSTVFMNPGTIAAVGQITEAGLVAANATNRPSCEPGSSGAYGDTYLQYTALSSAGLVGADSGGITVYMDHYADTPGQAVSDVDIAVGLTGARITDVGQWNVDHDCVENETPALTQGADGDVVTWSCDFGYLAEYTDHTLGGYGWRDITYEPLLPTLQIAPSISYRCVGGTAISLTHL